MRFPVRVSGQSHHTVRTEKSFQSLLEMKPAVLFSLAAAAVLALVAPITSSASLAEPSLVVPGDTFSLAVTGFSFSDNQDGIFLTPAITATFGTTQTFAGSGPTAGQTITVASSEVVGATRTTSTISISVPTNFAPAGTVTNGGAPIGVMFFDIGQFNGGTNGVNFALPITSPAYAGSLLYGAGAGTTLDLSSSAATNAALTGGGTIFADSVGVNAGGTDLSGFAVRRFTISVSYANVVPEPSTFAFVGAGVVGLGMVLRGRSRRD